MELIFNRHFNHLILKMHFKVKEHTINLLSNKIRMLKLSTFKHQIEIHLLKRKCQLVLLEMNYNYHRVLQEIII